jgi:hypothetical protein
MFGYVFKSVDEMYWNGVQFGPINNCVVTKSKKDFWNEWPELVDIPGELVEVEIKEVG